MTNTDLGQALSDPELLARARAGDVVAVNLLTDLVHAALDPRVAAE